MQKKEKNNPETSITIGKYVYIDEEDCLHTKRTCLFTRIIINEEVKSCAVKFVDTSVYRGCTRFCASCVNDETYDALKEIEIRHNQRIEETERKNLYVDFGE